MKTRLTRIYTARWKDRDYCCGLTREQVLEAHHRCWANGDPQTEHDAVGNHWATGDEETGWRIVERDLEIPVIDVEELVTDDPTDTWHIGWECPFCLQGYSDDWHVGDTLPYIVGCGCRPESRYILAENFLPKDSPT